LPLDPKSLPKDAETLKKIVVDLAGQLDRTAGERDRESSGKSKYAEMIRELLEAQRARKSEKLSVEQAGLFEELWRKAHPEEDSEANVAEELPELPELPAADEETPRAAVPGRASHARAHRTRSGGSGETLRLLRQRSAADRGRNERTLRIHSGVAQSDRRCAAALRLRMHGEGGGQTRAAD
jgi:hypothetical protein